MVIYPLEFYRRSERQWKHRVKASTPRPYASRAPDGHSAGIIAIKVGQSRAVEKIPKTKDEIQRLIIAELVQDWRRLDALAEQDEVANG